MGLSPGTIGLSPARTGGFFLLVPWVPELVGACTVAGVWLEAVGARGGLLGAIDVESGVLLGITLPGGVGRAGAVWTGGGIFSVPFQSG